MQGSVIYQQWTRGLRCILTLEALDGDEKLIDEYVLLQRRHLDEYTTYIILHFFEIAAGKVLVSKEHEGDTLFSCLGIINRLINGVDVDQPAKQQS